MRRTPWPRRRTIRNPLGIILTLLAIAVVAAAAALFLPPGPPLAGRAVVVDGDTLRIGDTRVRLIGLDAVELDQTCGRSGDGEWACGRQARSFVSSVVAGETTTCAADGRDRYGRVLARCIIEGADLGEQIVRAGWATADLEYGLALADARLNRRGIWSGPFDDPESWRRDHGTAQFDLWSWLMGLVGR